MKFGEILRKLREEENLSQVQLANILNITSQSLSQYELNKRIPDIEMIDNIASYFNVSIDFLIGRTNVRNYTIETTKDKTIDDIDNLSPESKEDLKRYLELLKIKDMQECNSDGDEIKRAE